MIALNLKQGLTKKFDLSNQDDLRRFESFTQTNKNQITGIWVVNEEKSSSVIPMPQQFRSINFYASQIFGKNEQLIGERVIVQADSVRLTVTNFFMKDPKMVKINLERTGKQLFIPQGGNHAKSR